ncbi:katanin p60 ATPase-containing subunit [Coprobacillus sp. CAG:698]|nr:katanin p60 ATPase-containing subunit [Coprobacillus sp. CAG:698]
MSDYNLENLQALIKKATELHVERNFTEAIDYYKGAMKLGLSIYDESKNEREKKELSTLILKLSKNLDKCKGPNFDDVVGLEDFKKLFRENIFAVVRNRKMAEKYKVKANCCILLQGPPGTGKSYGIKAAVNEFPEAQLFETKVSDLIDAYIGNTGKNIDKLFNKAKEYINEREDHYAIIFIDEIDGIARSRKSDDKGAKEAMSSLLVNLTKVDEENLNIIFIGATNTPDELDAAFLSRFGNNIVEIPLPDNEARKMILKKNLPYASEDINWDKVSLMTYGLNGRDLKFIAKDANKKAFNNAIEGKEGPVDEKVLEDMIKIAIDRRKKIANHL